MSKQYHYLIAGLPDLLFDDSKTPSTLEDFRDMLEEFITGKDWDLLKLYFYRYDNNNVLLRLKHPDKPINELGNLNSEEITELLRLVKDGSLNDIDESIPSYLVEFIEAFQTETPINAELEWDLQLNELYYNFITHCENEFMAEYFTFELGMLNLGTAIQCRKYDIEIAPELICQSDITEKLAKSTTRDFGLNDEILLLDQLLKVYDITSPIEKEKQLDLIKWNYIDEQSFFYYFTIERIFGFIIKLAIVERWISLDRTTGLELFNKLIKSLENSYEIPAEL